MKSRVSVTSSGVDGRTMSQQERNDVGVSEPSGDVKRGLLLLGLGVHGRAVSQQDANNVGLIGTRRKVQWRLAADRRHVWLRAVLDEEHYDVHATHE